MPFAQYILSHSPCFPYKRIVRYRTLTYYTCVKSANFFKASKNNGYYIYIYIYISPATVYINIFFTPTVFI